MSDATSSKSWVCALVAVAFAALGISGLLMLFHLNIPLVGVKPLHIVMGIVFIAAGVIHLAMNWKVFAAHLRNRSAIIAGAAAILIAVALLFVGEPEGEGPHRDVQDREEVGVGPGGDSNNIRGYGPGGRFGNGRWGDYDND